jgi:hypothetical protein
MKFSYGLVHRIFWTRVSAGYIITFLLQRVGYRGSDLGLLLSSSVLFHDGPNVVCDLPQEKLGTVTYSLAHRARLAESLTSRPQADHPMLASSEK